ncbi:hypothetical protein IGI04_040643 [Brassica rapa subsp. trilocularis]|uniref:Uncharacterized protein n=1 Tax=Brassica rapa subsp. trilocularis TaxID=1813537 RepID=A0ABQ7KQ12_BRACM|nr:hypothetical protein IGI04_040643 [Brassica rapa subsp. trilocularis]
MLPCHQALFTALHVRRSTCSSSYTHLSKGNHVGKQTNLENRHLRGKSAVKRAPPDKTYKPYKSQLLTCDSPRDPPRHGSKNDIGRGRREAPPNRHWTPTTPSVSSDAKAGVDGSRPDCPTKLAVGRNDSTQKRDLEKLGEKEGRVVCAATQRPLLILNTQSLTLRHYLSTLLTKKWMLSTVKNFNEGEELA